MADDSLPDPTQKIKPKSFDPNHFERFVSFAFPEEGEGCMELIAYRSRLDKKTNLIEKADYNFTVGGWFDSPKRLRDYAKRFTNTSAYVTINPVARHKLAHTYNKVAPLLKGEPTSKGDIVSFNHVYIDIDSCRPDSKISSTRSELEPTIEVRDLILVKYPEIADNSIWGCTGNGAFILLRTPGYPNEAERVAVAKEFLASLAREFNRPGGPRIDTGTFYPNVHMGLPGTRKCKGENMDDRPWRPVVVDGGIF